MRPKGTTVKIGMNPVQWPLVQHEVDVGSVDGKEKIGDGYSANVFKCKFEDRVLAMKQLKEEVDMDQFWKSRHFRRFVQEIGILDDVFSGRAPPRLQGSPS